jgi:hypothetical protein
VRALIDRYRSAGLTAITHEFYPGGRHEMLHELNRREVMTDLLVWMSGLGRPMRPARVTMPVRDRHSTVHKTCGWPG